jgi:hypothetical protein
VKAGPESLAVFKQMVMISRTRPAGRTTIAQPFSVLDSKTSAFYNVEFLQVQKDPEF